MFISPEEIITHLDAEIVDAISQGNNTLLAAAIDGAVAEVKGYLHDYDLAAIFAATGDDRNALLVIFVKDIAVWHFLNLTNAGLDYKVRQDRYNAAIGWLKGVQSGLIQPDLPKTEVATGLITSGSNPPRSNYI